MNKVQIKASDQSRYSVHYILKELPSLAVLSDRIDVLILSNHQVGTCFRGLQAEVKDGGLLIDFTSVKIAKQPPTVIFLLLLQMHEQISTYYTSMNCIMIIHQKYLRNGEF